MKLIICIKIHLALNILQRLICHKNPTNQPTNQPIYLSNFIRCKGEVIWIPYIKTEFWYWNHHWIKTVYNSSGCTHILEDCTVFTFENLSISLVLLKILWLSIDCSVWTFPKFLWDFESTQLISLTSRFSAVLLTAVCSADSTSYCPRLRLLL